MNIEQLDKMTLNNYLHYQVQYAKMIFEKFAVGDFTDECLVRFES